MFSIKTVLFCKGRDGNLLSSRLWVSLKPSGVNDFVTFYSDEVLGIVKTSLGGKNNSSLSMSTMMDRQQLWTLKFNHLGPTIVHLLWKKLR